MTNLEIEQSMPKSETVIYKQIANFPDYYLIGTDGSVWTCRLRGSKTGTKGKWWKMKTPLSHGYPVVNLFRDGKQILCQVHRLVLETFISPSQQGWQGRHLDGNPANSQLNNLAWGTQTENEADKLLHGRRPFGSKHGRHVLLEDEVIEIKKRLATGEKHKPIARDFDVHPSTISAIATDRVWWWLDK